MSERRGRSMPAPDVDRGWPEPPILSLDRGRALRAFGLGVLAAVGAAVGYGLLWAMDLHLGLIAVAVMGGWLLGGAVSHGAWRGALHVPDRRLKMLAAALGALAWLGGAAVSYLVTVPDPSIGLLERLSAAGFAGYLGAEYDLVDGIALATLAYFSWRSAG